MSNVISHGSGNRPSSGLLSSSAARAAPARRPALPSLARALFTLVLGMVIAGIVLLADAYLDNWVEAGTVGGLVVLWMAALAVKAVRHA